MLKDSMISHPTGSETTVSASMGPPLVPTIQATSSPAVTMRSLMSQSTIYRRHEARLQRSLRLRGDTRPAMIRVLSLLPGLDYIVPRYQPDSASSSSRAKESNTLPSAIMMPSEYSEQTLFATDISTTTSPLSAQNSIHQNISWAAGAMFSTGVAAAFADRLFSGQCHATSNNPFQGQQTHLRRGWGFLWSFSSIRASSLRSTAGTVGPVAMLFGARAWLLDRHWSPLASSATAGGISGALQHFLGAVKMLPLSSYTLMHHALASSLYFSFCDTFLSESTQEEEDFSLLHTSLVGGAAGCLRSSAFLVLSAITTATGAIVPRQLFVATMLRAAPTHAMIWSAYQSMRHYSSKGLPAPKPQPSQQL